MSDSLAKAIQQRALSTILPQGGNGETLDLASVAEIAASVDVPGHVVEAEALKLDIIPTRYLRNMHSITASNQIRLLESSIVQVGLGGLGGTLLDIFLRTGIGTIKAADGDHFEESNLNRQALATPKTLNEAKSVSAKAKASTVNPSISFDAQNAYLTKVSLDKFVSGADLVIDALGGLDTRLALQQAAAKANIPMVTGALAGWTGYISVVHPGHLGPADIMGTNNGAEEKLGCPASAVTFYASIMATEAIKLLSGAPSTLANSMLIVDLQTLAFERVSI